MLEYQDKITGLHDGPVKERRCTDVLFLLLFVLFNCGLVAIAANGFFVSGGLHGYARLVNGMSSDGKICGLGGPDGAGVANSHLFTSFASSGNVALCLPACPTQFGYVQASFTDAAGKVVTGSFPTYPSNVFLTYCFPSQAGSNRTNVLQSFSSTAFARTIADLGQSWEIILLGAVIALVLSVLFLGLLKTCGGCVVWLVLITLVVSLGAGGAFAWNQSNVAATTNIQNGLRGFAIAAWVLMVVIVCMICFLRQRIMLATEVMGEAVTALESMKSMFLLPILQFFAIVSFVAVWTAAAVYIVSSGQLKPNGTFQVPGVGITIPSKTIVWTQALQGMVAYHFFGLLWVTAFLVAIVEMSFAHTVGSWYFSATTAHEADKNVRAPIWTGLHYTLRYHLGSVAFGSLIVSIVQFIRAVLEYIDAKTKAAVEGNVVAKITLCCCKCCFYCLEKCIRFINHQAYIMIAIKGQSFCAAAKEAFGLVTRNILRLGALNMIGSVYLHLGRLMITAGTTFISYTILSQVPFFNSKTVSPMIPCVAIGILAYSISTLFMQVFSMTADTLFLCIMADEEMNGQARFASADIIRVLDDHQKENQEGAPVV
jgi:hypothetical protein